jgi:hypothetical protein
LARYEDDDEGNCGHRVETMMMATAATELSVVAV